MQIKLNCGTFELENIDAEKNTASFKNLETGFSKVVNFGLRSRGYSGKAPADYHEKHELGDWDVYILTPPGAGWGRVKLVRREGVHPKANYWLGYHYGDDRFSHTADALLLKNDPEFCAKVQSVLRGIVSGGCLRPQYATTLQSGGDLVQVRFFSRRDKIVTGAWHTAAWEGVFTYDVGRQTFIVGQDGEVFRNPQFVKELVTTIFAWALEGV